MRGECDVLGALMSAGEFSGQVSRKASVRPRLRDINPETVNMHYHYNKE
jgi:hypothetical protein